MSKDELRKRVAELRGWSDIVVLPSGDWTGTSPSGNIGLKIPNYPEEPEAADKIMQVIVKGGYWVNIREPKAPGQNYRVNIVTAGWGEPNPPPPGGNYEAKTREIAICEGFVVWAEWRNDHQ